MPISVTCRCGMKLLAKDSSAGKTARCPGCGNLVKISAAPAPLPEPSPPPPPPPMPRTTPGPLDTINLQPIAELPPPAGTTAAAAAAPALPLPDWMRLDTADPLDSVDLQSVPDLPSLARAEASAAAVPPPPPPPPLPPPPPPAPPVPPMGPYAASRPFSMQPRAGEQENRRTGVVLAVTAGGLLLLTLILPWGVVETPAHGRQPSQTIFVMSWDMVRGFAAAAPSYRTTPHESMVGGWLIAGWVLGGIVAMLVPLTPSVLFRGIILTGAGLILTVLAFCMVGSTVGSTPSGWGERPLWLQICGWLAVAAMLAGIQLWRRFPDRPAPRIIPGVAGAVIVLMGLISLSLGMWSIPDTRGVPPDYAGRVTAIGVVLIISQAMVLAAGAASVVNAFPITRRPAELANSSFSLACGGLGLAAFVSVILVPVGFNRAGFVFAFLNMLIVIFASLALLAGGGLTLATGLLDSGGPASRRLPVGETPAGPAPRLRQLKDLFDQGLIGEQEYDQKRRQTLRRM